MVRLSLGIGTLCMWIVPHVAIELAGFRILIHESEWWVWRKEEARKVMNVTSAVAIVFWILAYVVTCIGVALSTKDMDQRADAIVIGTGNLISAVALTMISFRMAKWLGVFHPNVLQQMEPTQRSDCITLRHLRFDIFWGIGRIFGQVYLLMMLQFCAVHPETVPLSALIGIVAGLMLYSGIYLGRTRYSAYKTKIAIILSAGLSVAASAAWAYGCLYIQTVWEQDTGMTQWNVLASMFFSWLFICIGLNGVAWWYTKKIARRVRQSPDVEDENNSNLFRTQMFRHKPEKAMDASNQDSKKVENSEAKSRDNGKENEQTDAAAEQQESQVGLDEGVPVDSLQNDENTDQKEQNVEAEQLESQVMLAGEAVETDLNEGIIGTEEEKALSIEGNEEGLKTATTNNDDPTFDIVHDKVNMTEEDLQQECMRLVKERDEAETVCTLIRGKCSCSCCCCCCGTRNKSEEDHSDEDLIEGDHRSINCGERVLCGCKWFFAVILNVFCLYFTIVNIGATSEMEVVSTHLPNATMNLYPPDYQNGTMCAWDKPTPDGTIKTFDTLQEVYDANWTVIHCEACANCSNWNDMEVQWITRDSLATAAQRCAMKSLFGSAQDVQQCYIDEVGFFEPCAFCWTFDSMCSKFYCTFIFLQAVIINNAGNFSVGPDHITSATCEEAMCGEEYAPCAGATRRRMNIESDIERPEFQQCSVAEHDWAAVFGHP